MTYYISTSTDDSLEDYIVNGMERWNNVDMSDFTFDRGVPDTTEFLFKEDGINLINIDSQFCLESHYGDESPNGEYCDQGILGFSGTFTPAPGSGEPFQAKESDIVLNGAEYKWADGNPIDDNPTIDTEAVIAHEAGHSAGLSHPGSTCLSPGSSGCGPEFPQATMYYAYEVGGSTNKKTLELDDVAALVYGYPRSNFQVLVINTNSDPIIGAQVSLEDTAAPVNGTSIATGGSVRGDIDFVTSQPEFGDGHSSLTYSTDSPFNDTDANGETNFINPVHLNFGVQVTAGIYSNSGSVTNVSAGDSTFEVILGTTEIDFAGPTVAVTSHTNGQAVGTETITLAGTATDSGRGNNGISQVTIDGVDADNDTATDTNTANWSKDITLSEGTNVIAIVAFDNKPVGDKNSTSQNITIVYDTTPPTVSDLSPNDGATGVSTTTNFGVAFSEAITPSTINTSTFFVDNGVTGTITYNAASYTATFVPSAPLAYDTTYTVTLTTGIQDAVGLAMESNFSWSITTRSKSGGSGGGGSSGCFLDSVTP